MSKAHDRDVADDAVSICIMTEIRRARVWLHTHGLREFGLPELEMHDVPAVFEAEASALINYLTTHVLKMRGTPDELRSGCMIPIGRAEMGPLVVRLWEAPPFICDHAEGESPVLEVLSCARSDESQ